MWGGGGALASAVAGRGHLTTSVSHAFTCHVMRIYVPHVVTKVGPQLRLPSGAPPGRALPAAARGDSGVLDCSLPNRAIRPGLAFAVQR